MLRALLPRGKRCLSNRSSTVATRRASTYSFDKPIDRYPVPPPPPSQSLLLLGGRRHTGSLKYDKYLQGRDSEAAAYSDILPLWVADMDFETPPPIARALQRRLEAPPPPTLGQGSGL